MVNLAEEFKKIAIALRDVNDRRDAYDIPAYTFASEVSKLDPRMYAYSGVFDNGYYGVRCAKIASTYYYAEEMGLETFVYGNPSVFSNVNGIVRNGKYAVIDCSTFVGLCLRGIPYDKSPFALHKEDDARWSPVTELESMYGTEGWEFRVLDAQPSGLYSNNGIPGCSTIRYAASIGEYFYKHGHVLYDSAVDGSLTDPSALKLQPGDLIFESKSSDHVVNGRFKSISHVMMVAENPYAVYHVGDGSDVVKYDALSSRNYIYITLIVRPDYRPHMPKEETPMGVNLLEYPWINLKKNNTMDGLTFTVVDMHSFTVNGTATSNMTQALKGLTNQNNGLRLSPGTYELSGITGRTGTSVAFQVRKADGTDFDVPVRYPTGSSSTNVLTLAEETDVIVRFYCSSGRTISNETMTPTLIRIA